MLGPQRDAGIKVYYTASIFSIYRVLLIPEIMILIGIRHYGSRVARSAGVIVLIFIMYFFFTKMKLSQISVTGVLWWSRVMGEWPGWPWLPTVKDHCLDQVVKLTRRGVCTWQSGGVGQAGWTDFVEQTAFLCIWVKNPWPS